MMVNKKCDNCGEKLGELVYESNYLSFCYECGEELLTFNDDVDAYIFWEDDKEVISDDEGVDIDMFELLALKSD